MDKINNLPYSYQEDIKKAIQILKDNGATEIFIFGSIAKGNINENSDIDIAIKGLNAKDFGIPQNRERVFIVGFRNDLKLAKEFSFPTPIKLEKKMQDFLIDNAPGGYFLPEKGVDFVTDEKNLRKRYTQIDGEIQLCQKKNQQFNWHGDFVFQSEEEAKQKIKVDLEKYFLYLTARRLRAIISQ